MGVFYALWTFRGFILSSVKREFQSKYLNSLFGVVWVVANPLAMILVYTVIFSQLMKARLPGVEGNFAYSIYLCSGMLTWGFFSEVVTRAQNVFLDNANLIKKLSFPRLCLPVIVVCSASLNFAVIFGLFLCFLIASGQFPGVLVLAVLPILVIQVLFSVGLGVTLGVFNVFFRDVGQAFGIILSFWFWFTPIVYPASILPPSLAPYLQYNPMTPLIAAYQDVFVFDKIPAWGSLLPVAALAAALCLCGLWLFRRHSGDMVDEL